MARPPMGPSLRRDQEYLGTDMPLGPDMPILPSPGGVGTLPGQRAPGPGLSGVPPIRDPDIIDDVNTGQADQAEVSPYAPPEAAQAATSTIADFMRSLGVSEPGERTLAEVAHMIRTYAPERQDLLDALGLQMEATGYGGPDPAMDAMPPTSFDKEDSTGGYVDPESIAVGAGLPPGPRFRPDQPY